MGSSNNSLIGNYMLNTSLNKILKGFTKVQKDLEVYIEKTEGENMRIRESITALEQSHENREVERTKAVKVLTNLNTLLGDA